MTGRLHGFAEASRNRAARRMEDVPLTTLEETIEGLPPIRPFAVRLTREAGPLPRVIAELKQSSPSAGVICASYRPRQIALGYMRVGAAALSVLTEPDSFGGDLGHILEVRSAHLPTLRKDFLVTPYQVAESRAAAADAVLLIAAILDGPSLGLMLNAARRYGVEALVEVHDEDEIVRALDEGAGMIGVNNRNLETLEVDLKTSLRLAPRIPAGVIAVSESGIRSRDGMDRLMQAGYEAFLIGESLLRKPDPGDELWRLMQPSS